MKFYQYNKKGIYLKRNMYNDSSEKKYFSPREKVLFTFETWERQKFTRKGRMKNDLGPLNTIEKSNIFYY